MRKRAVEGEEGANSAKLKLLCLSFEHLANCPRQAWPAYPIRIKTLRLKTIEWKRWEKTNEIHADCTWLNKITANLLQSNFPPFRLLSPLTFPFFLFFLFSFFLLFFLNPKKLAIAWIKLSFGESLDERFVLIGNGSLNDPSDLWSSRAIRSSKEMGRYFKWKSKLICLMDKLVNWQVYNNARLFTYIWYSFIN